MRLGTRRVAFLTHTPPLPAVSGERIRNWSLLRELASRGWKVSLFSLVQGGAVDEAGLRAACVEVQLEPFAVSTTTRQLNVLFDTARRRAFHEHYFVSPAAVEASRAWLSDVAFDVIVIATPYMVPYVPEALLGRSVLDTHNSETRRIELIADALGLSPQGLVARFQTGPVARFERDVAQHVARLTAVSEQECAIFETLAPGRVDLVPNGVDCEALRPRGDVPAARRILFLGRLDYSPNVDAVSHLVDDVLPRLRAGGGTRLKILEALARGVPVVSTTIGCEGLGLRPGEDLLVAEDPRDFAGAVERLLVDDDLCRSLAAPGRATVEARYDWRVVGDAFERVIIAATPC